MVTQDMIVHDADLLMRDINEFKKKFTERGILDELLGMTEDEYQEVHRELKELIERTVEILNRLRYATDQVHSRLRSPDLPHEVRVQLAHGFIVHIHGLQAKLQWLESTLKSLSQGATSFGKVVSPSIQQKAQQVWSWFSNLLPAAQRLLSQAWQMVMSLNTPKEWSIAGQFGPGFANVQLEITFGP